MKIGDLVNAKTDNYGKLYTILDIYTSEKTGERLFQVAYTVNGTPSISLTPEDLFRPRLEK